MRVEDAIKLEHLDPEAREELKDADQTVKDLEAIAMVSTSSGGLQLTEMLREDCRDLLIQVINAKKEANGGWQDHVVNNLLPSFEAKFTLFNTIKSASLDYDEAEKALNDRLEEILEG
jgi:hypothetical protein